MDRSRKKGKIEVGIKGPNFTQSKSLGTATSIFHVKIHAIDLKSLKDAKIYIMSEKLRDIKDK